LKTMAKKKTEVSRKDFLKKSSPNIALQNEPNRPPPLRPS